MEPIAYRELDMDAPADRVWDVIKDPWDLGYVPRVQKVERADGDVRVVHIAYDEVDGYEDVEIAYERCFNIDHEDRSYNYSWEGDYLPITEHTSTVKVHETGNETSKLVWSCVWTLTEDLSQEKERELAVSVEDIWWTAMLRIKEIVES
jgi:carbon monoxide dehydrogenase subunit G